MSPARHSIVLAAALACAGCGAEFDPPHEIQSLRVMAVQKSHAYGRPGEQIEMRMLWHDGSESAPREVDVAWFSGCFNPPGDLYTGCFAVLAGASGPPTGGGGASGAGGSGGAAGGAPTSICDALPPNVSVPIPGVPNALLGCGDRFTFTMPDDVISSRPPPADPKHPPYGLGYVFFAACAGKLGPAPAGELSFPVACYAPDGERLGADDFVAGYSAVYSFDQYRNENPIITGFEVDGVATEPTCIGDACLGTAEPDIDCSGSDPRCIDACADDGSQDCPGYTIQPVVDPASAEVDQLSLDAYGDEYQEQMWIRYYVDAGGVDSDVRLLNDATKGWNGEHETKLRAPKDTGRMRVWAVVHDNRGGVSWVRQDLEVR